ncbi:hypothetical protein FQN54_001757 [Arachnomyces sp. PD_36]|nr:hypothetical protein FQN54_001757 [Arachnomyces sp. PD_36]
MNTSTSRPSLLGVMDGWLVPDFSHRPSPFQGPTNLRTQKRSPHISVPESQEEPPKRKSMDIFRLGSSKRVSSAPPFEVKRASSYSGATPTEFAMTVTDTAMASSISVNTTTRTTKKSFLSVPKSPFRPGSPSFFKSRRQRQQHPEDDRDEIPSDPARLDGFINYHLSELERLKREVEHHNVILTQLSYTLADVARREGMEVSTQRMQKHMQDIVTFRTSLGKTIGYHRFELERVAEFKKSMGGINNIKAKIPEALINLPNDFEWRELFD